MGKQIPMKALRIKAACAAIDKAGGVSKLSKTLSKALGVEIAPERVQKWTTLGVPVEWGGILERCIPGVKREDLNPFEYTVNPLDIHKKELKECLRIRTG